MKGRRRKRMVKRRRRTLNLAPVDVPGPVRDLDAAAI